MEKSSRANLDYIGILANVDGTVAKADFGEGLEVGGISMPEYQSLTGSMARTSLLISDEYDNDLQMFHVVKGRVASDLPYSREDGSFFAQAGRFQREKEKRIHEFFDASMLVREGAPYLSKSIFLWTRDNQVLGRALASSIGESSRLRGVPMSLDREALDLINNMMRQPLFPLKPEYLQFAFDNLKLSYKVDDTNLAFVSTVTALESLLADGSTETRYKVSRNAAVLLGEDLEDCKSIRGKVADAYDLRSAIVHGPRRKGKQNASGFDLDYVRSVVRRVIRETMGLKKSRDELLDYLTAKGYKEK